MLLMKKLYFDAIVSRAKTTTLRYWRSPRVRAHSVHKVPGLGAIRIESVRRVNPIELTDADARADGFESMTDLMRALRAIYPFETRSGRHLYQVHFTFLPTPSSSQEPTCRRELK